LCKEHYEEWEVRRRREDAATEFLHTGVIEGQAPSHPELREEFQQLSKWWGRVCHAVQMRHDAIHMPLEEADYAISWCNSIAQYIIEAELIFRAGKEIPTLLKVQREPFWERFHNLEAGLASNGLPRTESN
jgi:hypothetical protein